jgi:hypothetical protein
MEDPLPASTATDPQSLRKRSSEPGDLLSPVAAEAGGEKKAEPADGEANRRVASLTAALRRARIENAEHATALADLRAAEIARLEILAEALAPVIAQVPRDCDIFDVAVSPGERPRLFIDQIGFVEMDRDRRTYRFLQDTRHGRITLHESGDVEQMVEAATGYIAHRLIEREKALAVDYASGGAKDAVAARTGGPAPSWGAAYRAYLYLIEFLGAAAFFALLATIAVWAYRSYYPG